jgi:hypothetical protein
MMKAPMISDQTSLTHHSYHGGDRSLVHWAASSDNANTVL